MPRILRQPFRPSLVARVTRVAPHPHSEPRGGVSSGVAMYSRNGNTCTSLIAKCRDRTTKVKHSVPHTEVAT
jgi:hypothetical protein